MAAILASKPLMIALAGTAAFAACGGGKMRAAGFAAGAGGLARLMKWLETMIPKLLKAPLEAARAFAEWMKKQFPALSGIANGIIGAIDGLTSWLKQFGAAAPFILLLLAYFLLMRR